MDEILEENLNLSEDSGRKQIVVFQLGNEEYAVDITQSKQIIKVSKITPVPNTAEYIRGVINLRGQIVPVVDLRTRFNITGNSNKERIITVDVRDSLIGLVVDNINEVLWYQEDELEPAPEVEGGIKQEYVKGVIKRGERLLVLIDLDKMLFESRLKTVSQSI
ncbi:MAG: chemotaxis protein CheW [Halanaerobiales bacterium]